MNLPTTVIFLGFVMVAWAEDLSSNQTIPIEDSLDFVDDAQSAASLVEIGVTQATIITATPTKEKLSNSSKTDFSSRNILSTIVTATTDASTKNTSTTETSTTGSSTTETLTTDASTTDASTKNTSTTETSTTETSTTQSSTTQSSTTESSSTSSTTTTMPSTTTAQPSEEDIFLALLAENTVALTKSDFLANILNSESSNIISDLNKQVKSLAPINDIEKHLLNVTGSLAVSEADILQSLLNSIYKVDYFGNRTINTVSYLLKFREINLERVNNFSEKLIGMQEQILRSSKVSEEKLSLVNKILKQYITPRINNLNESFANINGSQLNSEAELKNLPLVKNLTETSIIKATSLLNQLAMITQAQDKGLYLLEEAVVNKPNLGNLKNINELLHSVSISQKRIDLAFSVCESSRSKYNPNKYAPYLENVNNGSQDKSHLTHSKNCQPKTYEELSEQLYIRN